MGCQSDTLYGFQYVNAVISIFLDLLQKTSTCTFFQDVC